MYILSIGMQYFVYLRLLPFHDSQISWFQIIIMALVAVVVWMVGVATNYDGDTQKQWLNITHLSAGSLYNNFTNSSV